MLNSQPHTALCVFYRWIRNHHVKTSRRLYKPQAVLHFSHSRCSSMPSTPKTGKKKDQTLEIQGLVFYTYCLHKIKGTQAETVTNLYRNLKSLV